MPKYKLLLFCIFCLIINSIYSQDKEIIQKKINSYISQAKLDSAKTYINTQLKSLKSKDDKNHLNYQLVKVLFMQSAYDEALKQAFDSLDAIDDKKQRVKYNFMIGCIYSAISDFNKSVEYFDLVIAHNQDNSLSVQTHLLLSELHTELKDSTSAGQSLKEAYKITNDSDLDDKLKSHVSIQYNYFNKNYEFCKQENLKIIRDTTNFLNTKSYAYSMIGDCLIKQDSIEKATIYFDELLKLTFETKDPEQIKVAAKKLIEVYEKTGDQEKANTYHKIYNEAVNDTLSFSIEKYRDLYTIEKNRELNIIKSKNTKRYTIIASLIILALGIFSYLYLKNRNTKKVISETDKKPSGKKIVISANEIKKITVAIDQLKTNQSYLKPNITRKSFCLDSNIKSERYLSHYINENYKKSFSVFINDLRVEYAFNRIQNDKKFRNYKVEEIAKECGFGSKKSFERAFSVKYNQTPFKLISQITS